MPTHVTLKPIPSTTPLRHGVTQIRTQDLLAGSLTQVVPPYELEKQVAFKAGDQLGIEFATRRLASGAKFIRDMIVEA